MLDSLETMVGRYVAQWSSHSTWANNKMASNSSDSLRSQKTWDNLQKLHEKRKKCVFVPVSIEPKFWSMFHTVIWGKTIVRTCTKARYKVDKCPKLRNWYDITHPSTIWTFRSFEYMQLHTRLTIASALWNDVKAIHVGEEAVLPRPICASLSNRAQNQPDFTDSVPWDLIMRLIRAGEHNIPRRPLVGHEHLASLLKWPDHTGCRSRHQKVVNNSRSGQAVWY